MRREATLATFVRLLAASANNLDQIIVAALIGSVPLAFYGSPAKTVGGPGLLAALRIASKPPVNYR
jgi:hypothetical protein